MTDRVNNNTGIDLNIMTRKHKLDLLLHGKLLQPEDDFAVARAVHQFISATKRFAPFPPPASISSPPSRPHPVP